MTKPVEAPMKSNQIKWSTPYYGISHSDKHNGYRCTVRAHTDLVVLAKWRPNCGFTTEEEIHATAALAKAAGEGWLREVTTRSF